VSSQGTKERILDAGEKLFGQRGFAGTSLREITREAEVNLAAVHYHFGSKEALLKAVFDRIVGPTNHERLERLEEVESRTGESAPTVEAILEAFIAPDLRLIRDLGERGLLVSRFLGRATSEPSELVQELIREQFGALGQRFLDALSRALPDAPRELLFERLLWVVAILTSILADTGPAASHLDPNETEALGSRLITFAVAGMRAPAAPTKETP
jgi:AcrR family transcriptional regulator